MNDHTLDDFEFYFLRDLEKAYSADIACCGACHCDFVAKWPQLASGKNTRFEASEILLDHFYDGSYLCDEFTREEYASFLPKLRCPRCHAPIQGSLWAFNFEFNVLDGFEQAIEEISALAIDTPFLLLEHSLCRNILSAITDLAKTQPPIPMPASLFRARRTASATVRRSPDEFGFPQAKVVGEGRYNHAGQPVLYLADSLATCIAELRDAPCLIAELAVGGRYKVLDLTDSFASHHQYADLLDSLVFSALLSATQDDTGMFRPHYVVSRFVKDCAFRAGFDCIKYPSTRLDGFNLVLLNPPDSFASIWNVIAYHEHQA